MLMVRLLLEKSGFFYYIIDMAKISDLIPDDRNFNKGTEFGDSLLEKSLRDYGAGRSILIDKNNRIIAGNKTAQKAGEIGLDDVIIVETDGNKIIAVKRTDIDLDSEQGRKLALADNATGYINLNWDNDELKLNFDAVDLKKWGLFIDVDASPQDNSGSFVNIFEVVIECTNESEQENIFNELTKKGYKCRVLTL